ncbi:nucleoside hydrolase [Nonomuraea longicatena]|uniref:nucleoside hydrolase n=1 Tax=Nonomuraea longicatena TaxID=83682 RepID=UPI0031D57314
MRKFIIDCDPGIDDAVALVLAAGSDGHFLAITTVGGNVGLDLTTANALALREFLALDVPVIRGTSADAVDAAHVHGASGLGGALLPPAVRPADPGQAADFIVSSLRAAPGEITLVAVGPLTNLAHAVRLEPRIAEWARDLVVMGGTYGPGTEFNIRTDPAAAATVFGAGWTVTMVGLDITRTAQVTTSVLERMRGFGRLSEDLLLPAVQRYAPVTDTGGPALHDAMALAHVLDPGLLTLVPASVTVDPSGATLVDFEPGDRPNALVATALDVERFWDLLIAAFGRAAARVA